MMNLLDILHNLMLPLEIAVAHVNGQQKGNTFQAKGNRLADKVAQEMALKSDIISMNFLTPEISDHSETLNFTEKEKETQRVRSK